MKKISMLVLLCICDFCIPAAFAQSSLQPETLGLVDAALEKMFMRRSDIWLPHDAVQNDPHRLNLVKSLFDNPLLSFDVVERHAGQLKNVSFNSADDYFSLLCKDMEFGVYSMRAYDNIISARALDDSLRIGLDTAATLTGAVLLRQYCGPFVLAHQELSAARANIMRQSTIFRYCDSLLMNSEEDEKLSLYELRRREEEGLKISKKFYALASDHRLPVEFYASALSLYRSYLRLIAIAKNLNEEYRQGVGKTIILDTPYGKMALGGIGDDVYDGDFCFILDVGGNDVYNIPVRTKAAAAAKPLRAIIDLQGNDRYFAGNYALGGAVFGCDIVLDAEGNDNYIAGDFSLGAGLFGVGILHDFSGTDRYLGHSFTQGAGSFGIGILFDDGGNDSYSCYSYAQAFAGVRGFGALVERGGNDIFSASSPFQDFLRYDAHYVSFVQGAVLGSRPVASAGVALLADYKGNDVYISDIYGQGTAYWYGLGALYDESGDDRYQAYQYAQGSGVHLAHGLLWDNGGDDVYVSHGVSQGCGHDIAVGTLYDKSGDDQYCADGLSLGGGNANAISILLDERGNDAYIARNAGNTLGYSDFRRSYGMIGLFIDGSGLDVYPSTEKNNSFLKKSTYGIFADMNLAAEIPKNNNAEPALTPPDSLKEPLRNSMDSLFVQASAAPQKYQYNVGPAREKIIALGADALPFLRDKMDSDLPRERLALQVILPKIYIQDSAAVRKAILEELDDDASPAFGMAAYIAGVSAIKEAAPILYKQFRLSNRWNIRAAAAEQLGLIGLPEFADSLARYILGESPHVRMRIAYSVGSLLGSGGREVQKYTTTHRLRDILGDSSQLVRYGFFQGLKRKGNLHLGFVQDLFSSRNSSEIKKILAPLIYEVDTAASEKKLSEQLLSLVKSQPSSIREIIYSSVPALALHSEFWKSQLQTWKEMEHEERLQNVFPNEVEEYSKTQKKKQKKRRSKKSSDN